jgi:hypothetical protein
MPNNNFINNKHFAMKKLISIALLLSFAISLKAGWEITYRVTNMDGMINYDVMLIDDHRIKYKGTDFEFILNTDQNEMTIVLEDSKAYWSGNPDEFRSKMDLAMKKIMNEMMADIPESQRAMYSEMLGGMANMYSTPSETDINSVNIKISNTDEAAEIAGFSARKHLIEVNGKLKESIWISSDMEINEDYNGRDVHKMLLKIQPNPDNESLHEFTDSYLSLMEKGIILKSVDIENETVEAIKIIERKILPEEFKIPDGYNQITIDEILQQQMMQSGTSDDGTGW